ncbi:hypothetical protein GCM10009805_19110 [Leucobacter chromiireducens subsp. solipictus]
MARLSVVTRDEAAPIEIERCCASCSGVHAILARRLLGEGSRLIQDGSGWGPRLDAFAVRSCLNRVRDVAVEARHIVGRPASRGWSARGFISSCAWGGRWAEVGAKVGVMTG